MIEKPLRPRDRYLGEALLFRDTDLVKVVVRNGAYEDDANGIRIVSARDFFLG